MKTLKARMYLAGLSNRQVETLYQHYGRLLMLTLGSQPEDAMERHFQAVLKGTAVPNTSLEMAWLKFHAYKMYEQAKSCEQAIGSSHPRTINAFKVAAGLGSYQARKWLSAKYRLPMNYWRNTLWTSPHIVTDVFGSSSTRTEL